MTPGQEPVIDALQEVWSSISEATQGIEPEQWDLPTDCPGWSVRDHLSHLIGIERTLLGDPHPVPIAEPGPHVRNDIGKMNEAWVEQRRSKPGSEVLIEWRGVAQRRLDALREKAAPDWEVIGPSPLGQVPYRRFMWLRVMDSWVHEQDVRQALGRPGGRHGAGERETLRHVASLMPYVLGRNVKPPEGTSVVWDVNGPMGQRVAVGIEGGRGRELAQAPANPTALLSLDETAFWRLGCGRARTEEVEVQVEGDQALARRVLDQMNFMI